MPPSWLSQHVTFFSLHVIGLSLHSTWLSLHELVFHFQLVRQIRSHTWDSNSCSPYQELGAPTKELASRLLVRVYFLYIHPVFLHTSFPAFWLSILSTLSLPCPSHAASKLVIPSMLYLEAQSIQSARLPFQSSELGPTPCFLVILGYPILLPSYPLLLTGYPILLPAWLSSSATWLSSPATLLSSHAT